MRQVGRGKRVFRVHNAEVLIDLAQRAVPDKAQSDDQQDNQDLRQGGTYTADVNETQCRLFRKNQITIVVNKQPLKRSGPLRITPASIDVRRAWSGRDSLRRTGRTTALLWSTAVRGSLYVSRDVGRVEFPQISRVAVE